MNSRNLIIGCSIALGAFMLLIVVGGFALYHFLLRPNLEMPAALKTPSVVKGSGFVAKSTFIQDTRLGKVTDIVQGELDSSPGTEIGIAGANGAIMADANWTTKSFIAFSTTGSHVDIVDVENDGTCEFMNRGAWSSESFLLNHNGQTVWTYGAGLAGVDDMAAGDLDGDGIKEFAVGFNGGDGIHLLNSKGHKLWEQSDGNVWHVEMTDANGDGRQEIVHSNAGGQLTIRNAQGSILSQGEPPAYFSGFSLTRWPTSKSGTCILSSQDDKVWLLGFNGTAIAELDAPLSGSQGDARGSSLKLKHGEPEYFAVLVEMEHWNRSVLYIYDSSRNLVYQEVLPEACASIVGMPTGDSGAESLLIGGEGKVLKYSAP